MPFSLIVAMILFVLPSCKPSCLFFSSNSICFKDSAANLAEKMKDMAVCEKPSPSQV